MNRNKTSHALVAFVFGIALTACANSKETSDLKDTFDARSEKVNALASKEVTLLSRYHGGTYNSGIFSFKNEQRADVLNDNDGELQFEGRNDFKEDYFSSVMVVDQIGMILDLGDRNCSELRSAYEIQDPNNPDNARDRVLRPMNWLEYTDAWDSLRHGGSTPDAKVLVGHCYLLFRTNSEAKIVALFHVKSHVKSRSVVIDQIEIFEKKRF